SGPGQVIHAHGPGPGPGRAHLGARRPGRIRAVRPDTLARRGTHRGLHLAPLLHGQEGRPNLPVPRGPAGRARHPRRAHAPRGPLRRALQPAGLGLPGLTRPRRPEAGAGLRWPSGLLGDHLDGAAGAFGGAQAAALAVVVVDLVLTVGELDDGVVGADAVAVVAAEAVATGHAAA